MHILSICQAVFTSLAIALRRVEKQLLDMGLGTLPGGLADEKT